MKSLALLDWAGHTDFRTGREFLILSQTGNQAELSQPLLKVRFTNFFGDLEPE